MKVGWLTPRRSTACKFSQSLIYPRYMPTTSKSCNNCSYPAASAPKHNLLMYHKRLIQICSGQPVTVQSAQKIYLEYIFISLPAMICSLLIGQTTSAFPFSVTTSVVQQFSRSLVLISWGMCKDPKRTNLCLCYKAFLLFAYICSCSRDFQAPWVSRML